MELNRPFILLTLSYSHGLADNSHRIFIISRLYSSLAQKNIKTPLNLIESAYFDDTTRIEFIFEAFELYCSIGRKSEVSKQNGIPE